MTAQELVDKLSTATPERLMIFAESHIALLEAARSLTARLDRADALLEELKK